MPGRQGRCGDRGKHRIAGDGQPSGFGDERLFGHRQSFFDLGYCQGWRSHHGFVSQFSEQLVTGVGFDVGGVETALAPAFEFSQLRQ